MRNLPYIKKFVTKLNDILTLDESGFVNARRLIRFFLLLLAFFALAFGITFVMLIRGFEEIQLPNVINKDIIQASKVLQKKKLKVYIVTKHSQKYDRFKIIKQKPESGTLVKQDRTIILTVSLGQKVSKIPNFVEKNIYDTKAKLLELFSAYETTPSIIEQRRYSINLEKDLIIDQLPRAGSPINPRENILFIVSRGIASNQIKVLNYRWENYQDIKEKLVNIGIDVRIRPVITIDPQKVGKIFNQSIKPGYTIKKGDSIEFETGVRKDFDLGIFKSKIYRIYSIRVPYRRNTGKQSGNVVLRNKFPSSFIKEKNEKTYDRLRSLRLVVEDELGTSTRFEEMVFAGSHLDIPYKTFGKGTVRVYLDGSYYDSSDF